MVPVEERTYSVQIKNSSHNNLSLLYAHAIGSSVELEERLLLPDWSRCAEACELIRFDFPGHGRSLPEHDSRQFTWDALASDLCKLLLALPRKEVVLAGSSMGAAVALISALSASRFSINVRGLVLAIPPRFGAQRTDLAAVYRRWAKILRRSGTAALVQVWKKSSPTEFFLREFPEAREIVFEDVLTRDPLSLAAAFEGAAMSDLSPEIALSGLSVPTLILARVDDQIHPVSCAEKLLNLIPHASLITAYSGSDVRAWPEKVSEFLIGLVP